MGFIAASSALVGAWANRCNVFVLVPLSGGAIVIATLIGVMHGTDAGHIVANAVAAVACLEAGYVAALIAPLLADKLRGYVVLAMRPQGRPPQHEPVLLPSVERPMQNAAGGRRRLRARVMRAE